MIRAAAGEAVRVRSPARLAAIALAALVSARARPGLAQLDETLFRADDGSAYEVLRNLGSAGLRITTVGGSIAGAASCAGPGTASGDPVAALGGAAQSGTLHPFDRVLRSHRLTPNAVGALAFDAARGGRVTLGSGGGALNVCGTVDDCSGAVHPQPLVPLPSSAGGVAGACTAAPLQAPCDGANQRQAFGFGLPATGPQFDCDDPADVTLGTTICAPAPVDGFDLSVGEAIVFVYGGDLQLSSFSSGAGGFALAADADNPFGCAAGAVIGATADNDSQPQPPTPTSTPVIEPTRPAIPVVSSPVSPSGALLVLGLVVSVLLALRRKPGPRISPMHSD